MRRVPQLIVSIVLLCLFVILPSSADDVTVWIGTDIGPDDERKGIYRSTLDTETGQLTRPERAAEIGATRFITLHPDGHTLYTVCRLPESGEGGVAAYRVSEDRQSLALRNTQPIGDGGASHLNVDRSGRCLFTAQYGGGSVAAFPLKDDGRISSRTTLIEHEGSGPVRNRQQRPHPHWVGTGPGDDYLYVPDLGADQVVIYRRTSSCGLKPHGTAAVRAGSGPRHMKFHPDRPLVYVLNELTSSVTVFRHDVRGGKLEPIQTITALPASRQERPNSAAEIRLHPNGRFVYTSNRGHDSIAVFQIDSDEGTLSRLELEPVRGSKPRNFHIDPTGNWLLAGGQTSNTVSVFSIDREKGTLTFSGTVVNCPAPISFVFQPTN